MRKQTSFPVQVGECILINGEVLFISRTSLNQTFFPDDKLYVISDIATMDVDSFIILLEQVNCAGCENTNVFLL